MPGISVKHTPSQGAATVREIVQFLESRPGVRRVYWGTGLETADTLHVHVGMLVYRAILDRKADFDGPSQGKTTPTLRFPGFTRLSELKEEIQFDHRRRASDSTRVFGRVHAWVRGTR